MYFRVTTYGFDAARFDEFLALADTFRDELKAIDGLETVHSCVVEEGQGMIISRYASEAAAEAARIAKEAAKAKAKEARQKYFTVEPLKTGYEYSFLRVYFFGLSDIFVVVFDN